jgi:hypothetical protein
MWLSNGAHGKREKKKARLRRWKAATGRCWPTMDANANQIVLPIILYTCVFLLSFHHPLQTATQEKITPKSCF